jgi:23S rRNA (adenine2030-N6)-methyltransferase
VLAYRHAFHAGNHADVLKHMVLVQLMRHMALKDKGYRIVDTHAGAGQYALDSPQALKKGEFLQGIARLWAINGELPPPVADYLQQVRQLNPGGTLRLYPGSPLLARQLLRPQDQLRLFELHPSEAPALQALLGHVKGIELRQADGFAALKSQLPPPTRRALVLIDPSYEGHADYGHVLDAVGDGLRRFAQAVVMVWYPVVTKPGAAALVQGLKALAPQAWLHARLEVQQPDALGFGLAGSGVMLINPPHTLHAQLRTALPWLAQVLAQHAGATYRLEQHEV